MFRRAELKFDQVIFNLRKDRFYFALSLTDKNYRKCVRYEPFRWVNSTLLGRFGTSCKETGRLPILFVTHDTSKGEE